MADLSAQALISLHLQSHFPSDPIIGEEDTTELRANASLRERVVDLVNDAFEQQDGWGKGTKVGEEDVLKAVDAGSSEGGREGRFWTIDPGKYRPLRTTLTCMEALQAGDRGEAG